MSSYRNDSVWNDAHELRCLIVLKKLIAENIPGGKQQKYCRELETITNLSTKTLNAKVGNYKSVAGYTNPTHASKNTIRISNKYKNYAIQELESIDNSI